MNKKLVQNNTAQDTNTMECHKFLSQKDSSRTRLGRVLRRTTQYKDSCTSVSATRLAHEIANCKAHTTRRITEECKPKAGYQQQGTSSTSFSHTRTHASVHI